VCNLGYKITFPEKKGHLDQDEEWFLFQQQDRSEKLKLHDYDRLYQVPGLYEEVVYDRLKCDSPRVVVGMLKEEMQHSGENGKTIRALDFGAGNGIVGERLKKEVGCEALIGVDIIPEARQAAERDRPDVYDEYHVMDLCRTDGEKVERLKSLRFNLLITVAALGYEDIPTKAFINAFNLLEPEAWVAFNIKDRFLSEDDESGFSETLEAMIGESFSVLQTRRYCHRLSIAGEPLFYQAVVGQKIREAECIEASAS